MPGRHIFNIITNYLKDFDSVTKRTGRSSSCCGDSAASTRPQPGEGGAAENPHTPSAVRCRCGAYLTVKVLEVPCTILSTEGRKHSQFPRVASPNVQQIQPTVKVLHCSLLAAIKLKWFFSSKSFRGRVY